MGSIRIMSGSGGTSTVTGRIFPTVFFILFGGFGFFFAAMAMKSSVAASATRQWTATPCRVIRSNYVLPKNSSDDYHYAVEYRYTANGTTHTSSRCYFNDSGSSDFSTIQRLMLRYPAGTSATCRVDPKNPAEAILEPPTGFEWPPVLMGAVFGFIGLGGLIFIWRSRPPSEAQLASQRAPSSSGTRKVLRIIFIVLLLVGGAIFIFACLPVMRMAVAAQSWPSVQATVVNSRVRSHSSDNGSTYSVDVLYRYQFEGKRYLSNKYKFIGGSSSGRDAKQQVVAQLPRGKQLSVFVNPSDPTVAVIERGFTLDMLLMLIPVVVLLIGGIGLMATLRGSSGSTAPKMIARASTSPATGIADRTPLRLTSRNSRRASFIGLTIFAIFWNLISWSFAAGMFSGRAGIFPMLFISIFLVIGLVVLGAAIHALLAVFNPEIELTLSRASVRLGDSVDLHWSFSGRFDRISRFTLAIEGREEARYRRGTSTVTDKKTFARLDLIDATRSVEIQRGKVSLVVPATTMHSFDASDNKIIWTIVAHGDIAHWPDVKDEFPIQILPLSIESIESMEMSDERSSNPA